MNEITSDPQPLRQAAWENVFQIVWGAHALAPGPRVEYPCFGSLAKGVTAPAHTLRSVSGETMATESRVKGLTDE